MNKSFYRKIGFGLSANDNVPKDAIKWATDQIKAMPESTWNGPKYSLKEMMNFHGKYNYTDRRVLRKKHKNSRQDYKDAKNKLKYATGHYYFEPLWLYKRHHEAVNGSSPVFHRFLHFWGNHFAIQKKNAMYVYDVGPYHFEVIAPAMIKNIEDLVYDVTISWAMIHNLDNSKSIGPNSLRALKMSERGRSANLNENHGRELLELHTVSPRAGYNQNDVIDMSKVMSGWMHKKHKSTKKEENVPISFQDDYHDSGPFEILGKKYKESFGTSSSKSMLRKVIKDLVRHPICIDFVSRKLCNHFVTENPSSEIIQPVKDAWIKSDGELKIIHEAVIKQALKYSHLKKFQSPETWLLQFIRMSALDYFPSNYNYDFKSKPSRVIGKPVRWLRNLGHNPYRPLQPNGWSDYEADWMSPEFLFRRIGMIKVQQDKKRLDHIDKSYLKMIVSKNFDNESDVLKYINSAKNSEKILALFSSKWMLKT